MSESSHNEIVALMRDVLGERYTHLEVKQVVIEENLSEQTTSVTCEATAEASGETSIIAGKGVGVIDALFHGVQARFSSEYPSLNSLRFHSFSVRGQLDTKQGFAGTDSKAQVTLEIANSEDKIFTFTGESRSVTSSAIITTLAGLEYFINSERAFVAMYHALQDARERNRFDLVQRYTNTMATLVQNTSYSEVTAKLRQDL
jgi:hypothetical protein